MSLGDELEAARYPCDDEKFPLVCEVKDLRDVMARHGVAVIDLKLTRREMVPLHDAFWRHFGFAKRPTPKDGDEPFLHARYPHPEHPTLSQHYALDTFVYELRTHPTLVSAFQQLYGTDDLVCTVDYYSLKRPTLPNHPEWRVNPLQLHWDAPPDTYRHEPRHRYQALLALNTHTMETGCFACVPGSANQSRLHEATANGKYVRQPREYLQPQNLQPFPLRAGCVVIWDFATAHANTSNFSTLPRMSVFCRLVPRSLAAYEKQAIVHVPEECVRLKPIVQAWPDERRRLVSKKI